jgi:hypothetical protein
MRIHHPLQEHFMKSAAVRFAVLLVGFASLCHATALFYDPFDYPVGTKLRSAGNQWLYSGSPSPTTQITNGNLAVTGLAAPLGNMVQNDSTSTNLSIYVLNTNTAFGFVVAGQTAYDIFDSFILQLDTPLPADTTLLSNIFAMGESNYNAIMLRRNAGDGSKFDIGLARRYFGSTELDPVWSDNGGSGYALNTPHLLVISDDLDSTSQAAANALKLWINPAAATFGAAVAPTATLVTAANNATSPKRYNQPRFYVNQSQGAVFFDEFRVGTNWADVTPPAAGDVTTPAAISPTGGVMTTLAPTLAASAFSSPDPSNVHEASEFVIRSLMSNAHYSFVTGALTTLTVPAGTLHDSTRYAWKVRYKGTLGLQYSAFSAEAAFETMLTSAPRLLAYDGAAYPTTNCINGFNGGSGWSWPWEATEPVPSTNILSKVGVTQPSLGFDTLVIQGGTFITDDSFTNTTRALRTLSTNDGTAYLLTPGNKYGKPGMTNWLSFLIACGDDCTNGSYGVELNEGSQRRLWVGKQDSQPRWYLWVSGKVDTDIPSFTNAPTFLVARMVWSDPSTNGSAYVWMNPVLQPTPPDDATAILSLNNTEPFQFSRVGLFSSGYRPTTNDAYRPIPVAQLDEVRFGETWESVTPVPEPAFFLLLLVPMLRRRH